jgi:hypothetical protein
MPKCGVNIARRWFFFLGSDEGPELVQGICSANWHVCLEGASTVALPK